MTPLCTLQLVFGQSKAAEKVEFHFEDVTIPVSIKELADWSKGIDTNDAFGKKTNERNDSELSVWLNMLGFQSRSALANFLNAPLVRDKSMFHQLLRSWAGRKLLDKVSDSISLDDDKTGTKLFNSLESLLEQQEEVSTLELLNYLPAEVIHFDLNKWFLIVSSWRDELRQQQKLLSDLKRLTIQSGITADNKIVFTELKESINEVFLLDVEHREQPLKLEIWNPLSRKITRRSWIVFMPGLGGDPHHFRWLARSLSHKGWPVVIINHPGSDSEALNLLLDGREPVPGGAEVFTYRLSDLNAVLQAKNNGALNISGTNVILMGHSLGALTSFLASGANPQDGLSERCEKALDDLSITNLSRLLQCQLVEVPLPEQKKIENLEAIVGINSFGGLLWPYDFNVQTKTPVLLTGGTYDLITPLLSEQLGVLTSLQPNKFSRVLIIEGASHFSPIRVKGQTDQSKGQDIFQLSDTLIGSHPLSVQSLLAHEIIRFLDNLESGNQVNIISNKINSDLRYYILDQSTAKQLIGN